MVEEQVGGGGTTAVSRVDGTIRRSTGWWSEAVHALLGYLEASRFDASPRFLGIDDHGREVLSAVPSRPCVGPEVDGEPLLASAASLVRSYHDLVVDWSYPRDGWQHAPVTAVGGEVICHNDLAPWNFLHDGDRVTGLVDWDVAAPGTRAWDLAYFVYPWVPRAAPENRAAMGRPADPAVAHRMTLVARQLRLLGPAVGRRDRRHPRPGRGRLSHYQDLGGRGPARMAPTVGTSRTLEAWSRAPKKPAMAAHRPHLAARR